MEEATELTTASKLKNIFAVVIMVLAVLKALILALTLFHVPVLGGASYEALTASSMIKGPAFGAWLNLITGLMVIRAILFVFWAFGCTYVYSVKLSSRRMRNIFLVTRHRLLRHLLCGTDRLFRSHIHHRGTPEGFGKESAE